MIRPAKHLSVTLLVLLPSCAEPAPEDTPGAPPADAPVTDPEIWLASLEGDPDGPTLGEAANVTRRSGYDNQPAFLPDGSFLYTRQVEGQTDIWRYDPGTGSHEAVTRTTPESEYSATPLPSGDGFSVIRVEADSTQRLWRFDMAGESPEVIFPEVAPVGYHAWADGEHAFLFVLGEPPTLQLAATGSAGAQLRAEGIGRSIQKVPGRAAVSWVQRAGQDSTEIRISEPGAPGSELVVAGIDGGDDHAWTPEGVLLQASGNTLYAFRPGTDTVWRAVGELPEGTTISRLAVSSDGATLALVVDTPVRN